jgi:molybdate transport system substrate-binding protein
MSVLRRGAIDRLTVVALASVMVLVALVAWLNSGLGGGAKTAVNQPLIVYCAGGLKAPLEAIRADYERETGQSVQIQYGGSNTLLANLKISGQGDIFLPADASYIELAAKGGLVSQTIPVARMKPIVAVLKGNPQNVRSLDDLLSGRLRISMTEPDAATTGKLVRDALTKIGRWEAFRANVTVFKPTVNDVANDLKLGAVDAGVIWDAMLLTYPELEAVPITELAGSEASVVAGVVAKSPQPQAALAFANYLAAPGKGQVHFQHSGFAVGRATEKQP